MLAGAFLAKCRVVLVYLPFFGMSIISDAVYAFLFTGRSCAFLHLMFAGAVWIRFFSFTVVVFVVVSAALITSCWG
jgi:hypothetical protein